MTAPTTLSSRRPARSVVAPALLVAALLVAGACTSGGENAGGAPDGTAGSGADTTTSATAARSVPEGGFALAAHTETLVDPTRPTQDLPETGVPPAESRTLVTTFAYPDAPGPFPLVAFAHGHNGHPRKFTELLEAWASAGFVVAAPAFPLSNDEVPGAASVFDLEDQAGDVSFVISESLRLSGDDDSFLAGRVDPEVIGVGGLSLGGGTTYLAAFDECCRDPRIDAAMVLDAVRPDLTGLDLDLGLPLLIVHADRDPVLPYATAEQAFAAASAPKYLVTLHEAVHASPYENDPDPADQVVIDTTTAFWRLYLAHDADAAADLGEAASVPGLATVTAQPG